MGSVLRGIISMASSLLRSGPVQVEPLSAPQRTFKQDARGNKVSNCLLIHKLLITGQGEQVVSRRGELDRNLLSSTCYYLAFARMTPLHLAAWCKSSATVASALVPAGADVDALDNHRKSPLHHASSGNPALVPVLIGAGCKVNLLDLGQCSPLWWAARRSNRSAVAALMSAAADPHLGRSPLTDSLVSDEMKDYIRSLSK